MRPSSILMGCIVEELKILIEAVANLPNAALWVLSGYLFYKVCIIGSIYGVIRFSVEKLHDWAVTKKTEVTPVDMTKQVACISESVAMSLVNQVIRLHGVNGINSTYIHASDVAKLSQAIDIVLAKK